VNGLAGLQPWLRPAAQQLLARFPSAQLSSTYRSPTEQAQLYANCSRVHCTYPVAPPGRSYHGYGRAFDVVAPMAVLEKMGALWERAGGTWGGRWKGAGSDPIHFEA
jgi:hypothetical protein